MIGRAMKFAFGACVALLMAIAIGPGVAAAQDYLLQSGDVIEVTVLEDPNLNRRVLVGPDGNVSLPLAGQIKAGGRTLSQVQSTIRARLSGQFVNPPSVTASLVALGPTDPEEAPAAQEEEEEEVFTFYVLGQVARPGNFNFTADQTITVLQALAIAGGPGVFAANSRIQIRSKAVSDETGEAGEAGEASEVVRLFDYAAVEEGAAIGAPIIVEDGMVIVVPERGFFE